MKRSFLNALTALSLVLLLAALALWLGVYRGSPSPVWYEQQPVTETRYAIAFGPGEFQFDVITPPTDEPGPDSGMLLGIGHLCTDAYATRSGGGPNILIGDVHVFWVSYFNVMVVAAIVPLCRLIPIVRAKLTTPSGHCRGCGYDLRASPERCPECGVMAQARGGHGSVESA